MLPNSSLQIGFERISKNVCSKILHKSQFMTFYVFDFLKEAFSYILFNMNFWENTFSWNFYEYDWKWVLFLKNLKYFKGPNRNKAGFRVLVFEWIKKPKLKGSNRHCHAWLYMKEAKFEDSDFLKVFPIKS